MAGASISFGRSDGRWTSGWGDAARREPDAIITASSRTSTRTRASRWRSRRGRGARPSRSKERTARDAETLGPLWARCLTWTTRRNCGSNFLGPHRDPAIPSRRGRVVTLENMKSPTQLIAGWAGPSARQLAVQRARAAHLLPHRSSRLKKRSKDPLEADDTKLVGLWRSFSGNSARGSIRAGARGSRIPYGPELSTAIAGHCICGPSSPFRRPTRATRNGRPTSMGGVEAAVDGTFPGSDAT